MTVLIVTRSDDNECVTSVIRAIEARGGRSVRLDTDRFPTEMQLAIRRDGAAGTTHATTLTIDDATIDLSKVTAIWHRRLEVGGRIPRDLDPQLRRASVGESRATILGLLSSLDVFCMDPVPVLRRAESKLLQLDLACRAGLAVPRTLITNSPADVRAFAAGCPTGVVTKMLSSFAVVDAGREQVVFTSPVTAQDLDELEGLALCPMTFQERIPKARELRVTIVGERCFAAAVDSQALSGAQDDWRREGAALEQAWSAHTLPRDIERPLLRLMDGLGLNYGAADLILTPDGRYVFLEVNPSGEYFWLERSPGLPISAAIADVLLARAPRRALGGRDAPFL